MLSLLDLWQTESFRQPQSHMLLKQVSTMEASGNTPLEQEEQLKDLA